MSIDFEAIEQLYADMQAGLAEIGDYPDTRTGYREQLRGVRDRISELRAVVPGDFSSVEEERWYFREVWPKFYGRYFFFVLRQRFWVEKQSLPSRCWREFIRREEGRAAGFFRRHQRFWVSYRCGTGEGADEFTRGYSGGCLYEPLSIVLDSGAATVASYRAAWGLAFEEYLQWLQLGAGTLEVGEMQEWKESLSAAAELIKSQAEAESVYIDGKPATAVQLRADFERRFRVDLRNFDNLLYAGDTLKKEETPYLSKLMRALMGRKRRLGK
ncbi:MAG TPA: RteC domain-containing protein [Puia sp.]|nr:RteC domain-containing protein [Puia sp.]